MIRWNTTTKSFIPIKSALTWSTCTTAPSGETSNWLFTRCWGRSC